MKGVLLWIKACTGLGVLDVIRVSTTGCKDRCWHGRCGYG
jgi:hypothetical protein